MLNTRCWVAAHMCVKSHFRTCDVRVERLLKLCVRCACVWLILGVRCAITLFGTNLPENATFCLKKMFLEHLFLLWNVLFCFGSSYSVLECLILF